jgi:hypothetical protein
MTYRTQAKASRSGRGHQKSQREKKKAKEKKHRSSGKYMLEEKQTLSKEEVVEKTLSRLRSLGNQVFAISPFSAYFGDWLVNLKDVLDAFEAKTSVNVDEQFTKERAQILADVERELEEKRCKEASVEETTKSLFDNKIFLRRTEQKYAVRTLEIEARRNSEITRSQGDIAECRKELEDLAKVKAGLFRAMSRKAKAQKEAELTQKLKAAQNGLELTTQNAAAEQERLRSDCEKRKQIATEQIEKLQKNVDSTEVDASLEARRAACESLANAVNAFLQRKTL